MNERIAELKEEIHYIGDGYHKGTNYYWSDRLKKWVVVDLENRQVSFHDSLSLVRCSGDPDHGLNQSCLGSDFENPRGLWLVDSDFVDSDGYLCDIKVVQ